MERKELLEVLGLSGSPTPAEIKAAHRAQSKRYHPDTGGSDEAMATINLAVRELLALPTLPVPITVSTSTSTSSAAPFSSITFEQPDHPALWSILLFFVGVPVVLFGAVVATVAAVVGF